jgi:hypothetical protein
MSELILMLRLRRRFLLASNALDTKSRQWKCRTFTLFTFFSKPRYIQASTATTGLLKIRKMGVSRDGEEETQS